jgi:CheY-like chemotaxis protein
MVLANEDPGVFFMANGDCNTFDTGLSHNVPEKQFFAPTARALVVDDRSTNLMVASALISGFGVKVDSCRSGKEAVELVKSKKYDVVFMDHMMPEMDGVETTEIIRSMGAEDSYYRNLPIVALTANTIAGQREMFLRKGMNDFIAKPIDIKKLCSVLKKWIPKEKQMETADARGICEIDALL